MYLEQIVQLVFKMALVKQEEGDVDVYSDEWLRDSFEVKEEQEDVKPFRCQDQVSQCCKIKTEKLTKVLKTGTESQEKRRTKIRRCSETLNQHSFKQNETENHVEKYSKISFKERMNIAPVSDSVGNYCEYECPKCRKKIKVKKTFYRHLKQSKHAIASKEIMDNSLVKIVVHQCFICFKKLLCIKTTIKEHVKKHNICSIEEYVDKTKATLGKEKTRCQMVDLHLKLNGSYEVTEDIGYPSLQIGRAAWGEMVLCCVGM